MLERSTAVSYMLCSSQEKCPVEMTKWADNVSNRSLQNITGCLKSDRRLG